MERIKIPIFEFRSRFRAELKKDGISDATFAGYRSALNHLIDFMEEKGFIEYNEDVGKAFSYALWKGQVCKDRGDVIKNMLHKIVRVLNYILGIEKSPLYRPMKREDYHYAEEYKELISEYFNELRASGRSDDTIARYQYSMSLFSVAMSAKGICPADITRANITDFFSTRPDPSHYYSNLVTCVKYFCRFLCQKVILKDEFNAFFKRFKQHRTMQKLLSFYTPDEIKKIEGAIDRATEKGKRDYAMILLGTRYGLRSSDIRNLKFSDIDWDSNKIRIVQLKTGNSLELPLLGAVGKAIADYAKNGRPPSRYTHIFVAHNYPYDTISPDQFFTTVRYYINAAGVADETRKRGTHVLRHSLATTLMNNAFLITIL